MVVQYHCWIFEYKKDKNVEAFRSFIVQEIEFQIAASDTVHELHLKKKKNTKTNIVTHTLELKNKKKRFDEDALFVL